MKNTFGNNISVTLFGESHGTAIGAVLDGMPAGVKIDLEYIDAMMERRRAKSRISTKRRESDKVNIISGVYDGYTTGSPITVVIENCDLHSTDYGQLRTTPRPSHADYAASVKYGGFADYRGGGHFSGRLTAPLVAVGTIVRFALEQKGVYICTHISYMKGVRDLPIESKDAVDLLSKSDFPTLSADAKEKMTAVIEAAANEGDSVGGILESAIFGLPAGIGEPWFDSLEGVISHAMFSIPGIKGVEFGAGFALADMYGSEANDPFRAENGKIYTQTNNSGGINGGISNGMPVIFRCAVRPTPSIFKEQKTVNLTECKNISLLISGRHDPAIIHRAAVVTDALTSIAVLDMLLAEYGKSYLSGVAK